MDCLDYWQSLGIDPLDAMFTVGCRGTDATGVSGGHDVLGGALFFALLLAAVCFAISQDQL